MRPFILCNYYILMKKSRLKSRKSSNSCAPCHAAGVSRTRPGSTKCSPLFLAPGHPIASGREDPASRLGKTVELSCECECEWARQGSKSRRTDLLLAADFSGWAGWSSAGEDMVGVNNGGKVASWLVHPSDNQARTRDVSGPTPTSSMNRSRVWFCRCKPYRISTTQDNGGNVWARPGESPLSMATEDPDYW